MNFIILKNTERYGDLGRQMPDRLLCYGTSDQAEFLASYMTNYYAGCDHLFYVEGGEADQ